MENESSLNSTDRITRRSRQNGSSREDAAREDAASQQNEARSNDEDVRDELAALFGGDAASEDEPLDAPGPVTDDEMDALFGASEGEEQAGNENKRERPKEAKETLDTLHRTFGDASGDGAPHTADEQQAARDAGHSESDVGKDGAREEEALEGKSSFSQKVRSRLSWILDGANPDDDQPGSDTPSSNGSGASVDAGEEETPFSHTEAPSNGRPAAVEKGPVATLLREGSVTGEQVQKARRRHDADAGAALWRTLARLGSVDADEVYAAVAFEQGIEPVTISAEHPSLSLVETVFGLLPEGQGEALLEAGLLPVALDADADAERLTLVLATHDAAAPAVTTALERVTLPTELRFAFEHEVAEHIASLREAGLGASSQAPSFEVVPGDEEPPPRDEAAAADAIPEPQPPEEPQGAEEHPAPGEASAGETSEEAPAANGWAQQEVVGASGGTEAPGETAPPSETALPSETAPPSEKEPSSDLVPAEDAEQTPARNPSAEAVPVEEAEAERGVERAGKRSVVNMDELRAARKKDRVVDLLMRDQVVKPEQVLKAQQRLEDLDKKEALWRVLAQGKDVDRESIFAEAARVYAFPIADLAGQSPDAEFTKSVMDTFPEEHRDRLLELRVVPLRANRERHRGGVKLLFVTHDPTRPAVHRLMRELSVDRFELQYAPESIVTGIIAEAFPRKNEYLERMDQDGGAMDLGTNYEKEDTLVDEEELEAEISRSKLINLFEATLVEAVRQGASDIHIYPNAQKKVEIHFRVDGRLKRWHVEDKVHPEALLAVIKDNAVNVDRFERDAAQDGFIQRWVDDALIRFRVSVMPIANASQEIRSESIVIRVLDDRKVITDLSKLGLLEGALEKFEHAINQPHGMVILTGPTGSGKSTTLVASLHSVVSPEVNVLTIEDPVEYIIPDVRQIKLSHKLSLDQALRSILRHDPDVVMVGEMRDRATAELAIKLANTGHLTFSTLHTNDAPSAISRLYKMGIEPFLIAYAINLVVAQRLIRTLCPACKQLDDDPDPVMLDRLGFTEEDIATLDFYVEGHDRNCPKCNGFSYKGRRAVSEALYFSRDIRHMIVEADGMINEAKIRDQATSEGMLTLQDSAREVVKMGETSVREMIRVVTSEAH